jgi:DNA-binding NtrC family response regulator
LPQALRQLHAHLLELDHDQATRVIILTAYGTIESAVEAMRLGANDYITKPIDFNRLFEKIDTLLARAKINPP